MTRVLAYALSSLIAVAAVANTDLIIFTDEFNNSRYAEPGMSAKFTVFIRNNGTDPAQNAILRVPLPPGSTLLTLQPPDGWTCSSGNDEVVCTAATVAPSGTASPPFVSVTFTVSPNDDGFVFDSQATITSDTPDSIPANNKTRVFLTAYRMLRVNTTADSGDGSLRSAITNANARCAEGVPCKIKFEVPRDSKIAPLTPLPAFERGVITMDGNRNRFTDRFIELDGEHLTVGNGLEIHSTEDPHHQLDIQIADMAINNFPQFGVAVTGPGAAFITLSGLFLGTDVTGNIARPNARGILIQAPLTHVELSGSVISGNTYSGVYAWNSGNFFLTDSLIGIASDGHALGNGKSGVFLYRGSMDVAACNIANNGQFGVSIEPEVIRASVSSAIHDNGIIGIDWGLNGPGSSRVQPPVITSVAYDAEKNQTVISGTIDTTDGPLLYVDVFASHSLNVQGRAEGELLLGRFVPVHNGNTFTARVPGDFRGQIITATLNVGAYLDSVPLWTSEFSEGVTAN